MIFISDNGGESGITLIDDNQQSDLLFPITPENRIIYARVLRPSKLLAKNTSERIDWGVDFTGVISPNDSIESISVDSNELTIEQMYSVGNRVMSVMSSGVLGTIAAVDFTIRTQHGVNVSAVLRFRIT